MPSFSPEDLITRDRHRILLGAVGPRPIALVSTVDEFGTPNLSPYSFFNIFSSNPPTLIFSPARRVRDNTTKDTLHNALREQEVVVNVVNYDLVQQVNLSSAEYPSHVDEFVKSGLTPVPSELVAPPRVAESPVSLECIIAVSHLPSRRLAQRKEIRMQALHKKTYDMAPYRAIHSHFASHLKVCQWHPRVRT